MTNSTNYTVTSDVLLADNMIIVSGSLILLGLTLGERVADGALSLITPSCAEFAIYAGVPATRMKDRRNDWNGNSSLRNCAHEMARAMIGRHA